MQTHPSLGLPCAWHRFRLRIFVGAFTSLLCLSAVAQQLGVRRLFNIPAQGAESALKVFSEQSGSGVIMNANIVDGIHTNRLHGTFAPLEALQLLLGDTGLMATPDEKSGAFVVHRLVKLSAAKLPLPRSPRTAETEIDFPPKNQEPMKTNNLLTKLSAMLAALTSAFAQSASPLAASATSPSAKTGSIIQLSPFEVTSNTDVGYQATDTLAGSRMNTALKDVAASISVFTEEFIRDINATDLKEVMAYANNFQPDLGDAGAFGDNEGGIGNSIMGTALGTNRVRGLPADISRNYFKWNNPTDTYNVGRVEDSRGPNSILFGIGNAGGIINVATKQALLRRPMREIYLSGGSFSSWRATIDVNQPLGDKAAVRFNAVANRTRYFQTYRYSESQRAHLAAKYEITPWLTARVEYERGEVEANSGRLAGVFDSVVPWLRAGRPLFAPTAPNSAFMGLGSRLTTANLSTLRYISNSNQLINLGGQIFTVGSRGTGFSGFSITDPSIISYSINSGGPGQVRTNPYGALSAIATARVGNKTFVEIGVNRQRAHFTSMDPVISHALYADPNTHLPGILGVNPYAGRLYMESNWRLWDRFSRADMVRMSISHEVDAGKWGRYRGGVFGDIEKQKDNSYPKFEVFEGRPFSNNPEQNSVMRRTYVTEGAWGSYYVEAPTRTGFLNNVTDPISGRTLSSKWLVYNADSVDDPEDRWNAMGMLQGHWFNGRIVAGAGYRKDRHEVEDYAQVRDPVTNEWRSGAAFTRPISQPQTRTFSAVWHALKNVSFKYNQATNSSTINSSVRVFPSTPSNTISGPASKGTGKDYGVTVSLLQGKLYASLVRYTTESIGELFSGSGTHNTQYDRILTALLTNGLITSAEEASRRFNANATSRDKSSDGYELSLTANPGNWRLSVNSSYTDGVFSNYIPEVVAWWADQKAYYLKFPQGTPTAVGTSIADEIAIEDANIAEIRSAEGIGLVGNAKYKASFFARYSFKQGFLKGAFVGGGYRYTGRMLVGRTIDASQRLQFAPPVGEAALLIGFERRVTDKARLSVQLNVSNLLDETDPRILRYANTGDSYEIKRIAVRDPRSWTLSTRLSF